jgi:hypothetical protein
MHPIRIDRLSAEQRAELDRANRCELFESVQAPLDATRDFFDRYNRKPGGVRSILGAHPA